MTANPLLEAIEAGVVNAGGADAAEFFSLDEAGFLKDLQMLADCGESDLEVGGKTVASADDVRDAISAARTDNKNSVLMRVKSGGSSRFVAVPLAKG